MAQAGSIAGNIDRVRERIARAAVRAGRRTEEIAIIAVSKTFSWEAILVAHQAGLQAFGENRVQEFESKLPHLAGLDATWHLIGHLQSNKVRRAVQLFSRVDSVDSLPLAQKLDSAVRESIGMDKTRLRVLIEVHLGDESTKSGVAAVELQTLAEQIKSLSNLNLLGLMTIPPYFDDTEHARPYFRNLRELRDQVSAQINHPLPVLSMGMSHDFEVAIEEGATEVRVGSAIFGNRQNDQ